MAVVVVNSDKQRLFGPVVIIELRGVVLAVAALHSDTTGQDGSHIVAKVVSLLLLPLCLHLPQVEP